MSDLQIKITVGDIDVFLQGEGDLVYKVFCDIRENGVGELKNCNVTHNAPNIKNDINTAKKKDEKITTTEVAGANAKSKKKVPQSSGQLLKDLDLSEHNGAEKSLKDFIAEKNPGSNVQKTATFVYYLENMLKLQEITIDHIFTCYKLMGYRMPNNLQQNLADTCSSRYGYIGRKDGKFTMTVVGNNYIEFDMNKEG